MHVCPHAVILPAYLEIKHQQAEIFHNIFLLASKYLIEIALYCFQKDKMDFKNNNYKVA